MSEPPASFHINPDSLNAVLKIRMASPSLSEKEQAVTNYILDLGLEITHSSIGQIAEANNVSEAMIVKLAKKLEFSGYRDLKRQLAAYHQSSIAGLHREINPSDDAETSISKVFRTAIQALHETLSVLDYDQIEAAAQVLLGAGQRCLYGSGASGVVALDASHKFLRIGLPCIAYSDAHMMAMSASLLREGDVAVGVSYSGETRVVVEALQLARQNGATTIALTNFLNSPITECADIVLHSTARGSALNSESVAARIAQLCLIDSLFVRMAQHSYNETMSNLSRTMSSVDYLRTRRTNYR